VRFTESQLTVNRHTVRASVAVKMGCSQSEEEKSAQVVHGSNEPDVPPPADHKETIVTKEEASMKAAKEARESMAAKKLAAKVLHPFPSVKPFRMLSRGQRLFYIIYLM